MTRAATMLSPVTLAVLAGCAGGAGDTAWTGTVDSLSNGVVVVSNPAHGLWDASTGWRPVEDLRIGLTPAPAPGCAANPRT